MKTLTTILALTTIAITAMPAEAKKRKYDDGACKGRIESTGGSAVGNTLARRSARIAWSNDVKLQYGQEFQSFGNARNVDFTCSDTGAQGVWRKCRVAATACRG